VVWCCSILVLLGYLSSKTKYYWYNGIKRLLSDWYFADITKLRFSQLHLDDKGLQKLFILLCSWNRLIGILFNVYLRKRLIVSKSRCVWKLVSHEGFDNGNIKEKQPISFPCIYSVILTVKWFVDLVTIVGLPGNWYLITHCSLWMYLLQ